MAKRRKKRTAGTMRLVCGWTVFLVLAVAFGWLVCHLIGLSGDAPTLPGAEATDSAVLSDGTSSEDAPTRSSAPFPADLASQVTAAMALNQNAYPTADAEVYSAAFPLYPGSFADDTVELADDRWVVVIDPGHQDRSESNDVWLSPYLDPSLSSSWVRNSPAKVGATGTETGAHEYDITMAVARLLKQELEDRGFTVVLTKDSVSQVMTGPERASVSNKAGADLVVSLHCDGYAADPSARGALTQTPALSDAYPDARLAYLSAMAGEMILDCYCEGTGMARRENRQIESSSAFNWSRSPSVLLEMGFLTNAGDEKKLTSDSFRRTMASSIADGISQYLCSMYASAHADELNSAS